MEAPSIKAPLPVIARLIDVRAANVHTGRVGIFRDIGNNADLVIEAGLRR
jgi:hypothetical protein